NDEFALATSSVASTMPLTISASATGSTGGVSTNTNPELVVFLMEEITSSVRTDDSSPAGFGASGPEEMMERLVCEGTSWSASTAVHFPSSTDVKPTSFFSPKN